MSADELVVSVGEACALLGMQRRALPDLERRAGLAAVSGRSGYSVEELRALMAVLPSSVPPGRGRPLCPTCGSESDRMRVVSGGSVYGCTRCKRGEAA